MHTPTQLKGDAGTAFAELIAERFRLLGDATRIRLLDTLREGPATVGELQRAVGTSQQNVSRHLGVLLSGGILRRHRDGNLARYEIADEAVFELCEQVCGGIQRRVAELDAVLQAGARS